jgi:hypothetical protein
VHWHQVQLTAADISRGWHATILEQFETVFVAMGSPESMAMFATDFTDLAAYLYFSPATALHAAGFLRFIRAIPCKAPSEPVAFLAGDPNARSQIPLR